ncbi:adenylate/guanylate cyclase domain-containing protein [Spongiivirga citrea]|uniref:Adenylate/guanylate cyclase domain-containing protein n=1 Tax=Spongiivirga citrea TaxID=1481457 RepID=A0A6M0CII8_9FLAO|nr:adenylate/guanylate cyclase domain-containing protein [Spongiivirga citrea]NER17778.1 adenylate/guanylate cyclase domain-containing protein [Spongiivirga citrea]
MALSPKTKYNIKRILPFGVIWLILGALFLTVEHLALGNQKNALNSAIKLQPDVVLFALTGVTIIGLLVGCIEVLVLRPLFDRKNFATKIISKFFIYFFFFLIVILITYPIAASIEMDISIWDQKVRNRYFDFFLSVTNLSAMIQLGFSLIVSLLYSEISNNVGQNVLLNFFTGKYHKPVVENRIFMFVDMKDSTTIAEQLGTEEYFKFLRSYYGAFSNAIVKNHGEVYQYVGDEIVITWTLKNGLRDNNCIQCFFDMKSDLYKKGHMYLKKFNMQPDFKAALHFGQVTTGEIGVLKKDIFFTGDVLNTTARILGLCSTYKEDILLSKALAHKIMLDNNYSFKALGEHRLKGKAAIVEIVSLLKNP